MRQVGGVAVIDVNGRLSPGAVQPIRAALQAAAPRPVILDLAAIATTSESLSILGGMARYARARGSDVVLIHVDALLAGLQQAGLLDHYRIALDLADGQALIARARQDADLNAWTQELG